eukprot:3554310-Pyramimonas_sp.AAC.1
MRREKKQRGAKRTEAEGRGRRRKHARFPEDLRIAGFPQTRDPNVGVDQHENAPGHVASVRPAMVCGSWQAYSSQASYVHSNELELSSVGGCF